MKKINAIVLFLMLMIVAVFPNAAFAAVGVVQARQ